MSHIDGTSHHTPTLSEKIAKMEIKITEIAEEESLHGINLQHQESGKTTDPSVSNLTRVNEDDIESHSYCRITITLARSNPEKKNYRFTYHLCRRVFQAIGYDKLKATKFANSVWRYYLSKYEMIQNNIQTTKNKFKKFLDKMKSEYPLKNITNLSTYFFAVARLCANNSGLIILLGGASGTGKSSLTSLMSAKLGLQGFSSDNIRHLMRNFKLKSECPFIFASTYTADSLVKDEGLT